jgi:hypothetical protein
VKHMDHISPNKLRMRQLERIGRYEQA